LRNAEIMPRIERRRKWTIEEKAALLAEVEAEGGKVKVVARRHGISDSVLYNWRSAWKMAAASIRSPQAVEFMPVGVLERASRTPATSEHRTGRIEILFPDGVRLCVDALVDEKALSRILRVMKGLA
jgi:transposase